MSVRNVRKHVEKQMGLERGAYRKYKDQLKEILTVWEYYFIYDS